MSDEKHCFSTLSNQGILKAANDIGASKATSCQNISNQISKENINLYIDIFTSSFKHGTGKCKFLERLKLDDITPSHKKGDVTGKSN